LGRSVGSVESTYVVQGQLDFTVLDHDRTGEARILPAASSGSTARLLDDLQFDDL
jgi:hypothetical protein